MVCDKDGVWDVAGIVLGFTTGQPEGYELTYEATNGVSAVRLYAWGALFGADGQAVFDALTIEGTSFENAQVPESLRLGLRKLILKLKPLETWAALLVDYTHDEPIPLTFEEDETMVDNYRYQTTSAAGTLDILDTEVFHIAFKGTAAGYMARFDDARNFTMVGTAPNDGRMFRLTNHSSEGIVVSNNDLSYQKILPPKGVMQVSLKDNTTLAGVWEFSTHITGDAEEVGG
jgi:hypothetical protein